MSDPALTVLVVLELFALFISVPLADMGVLPPLALLAVELLTVAAAIVVVSWSRAAVMALLLTFAAGFAGGALRHLLSSRLTILIDFSTKMVFMGVLTWVVGIAVFGPGRVTSHRIWGAVAMYLQISSLFALTYLLILTRDPGAFQPLLTLSGPTGDFLHGAHGGAQLVYFSLASLTTTGYGDIVPVHPLARSLANLEGLIGQLFPATLLARLVTLELSERRHH